MDIHEKTRSILENIGWNDHYTFDIEENVKTLEKLQWPVYPVIAEFLWLFGGITVFEEDIRMSAVFISR